MVGATLVLPAEERGGDALANLIVEKNVTHATLPPVLLAASSCAVAATAVAVARIAAEAAPTAVAHVPIAADAPAAAADRVSNAVPAAAPGMTVVIREAVPVRRAALSSFPKC